MFRLHRAAILSFCIWPPTARIRFPASSLDACISGSSNAWSWSSVIKHTNAFSPIAWRTCFQTSLIADLQLDRCYVVKLIIVHRSGFVTESPKVVHRGSGMSTLTPTSTRYSLKRHCASVWKSGAQCSTVFEGSRQISDVRYNLPNS